MLAVSKSETQIIESSKTLMLSCARLEGLKNELSLVTKGGYVRSKRSRLAECAIFCKVTSGVKVITSHHTSL